ncbi:hypothetical protein QWY97_07580 [Vibrio cortegadensis]|uniref:hypothetical protein n=1 Tax=Vibrio cortegadensis TaxID=1328770 RepID=UPI0021C3843C|nr:hypothetical protein [Vibrio cortegadensis]MDN3697214.1 hypothetical protein [Vibrio cortegadensis]
MASDSSVNASFLQHPATKIIGIALAVGIGFFASDLSKLISQPKTKMIDDYCMVTTQTCSQNQVGMTLSRDAAQPLLPTVFRVEWPNTDASQLVLNLQGVEMNMGTARFSLAKIADGIYQGEIILPICTIDEMTWVGELTDGKTTVYPALRMKR